MFAAHETSIAESSSPRAPPDPVTETPIDGREHVTTDSVSTWNMKKLHPYFAPVDTFTPPKIDHVKTCIFFRVKKPYI